MRFERLLAIALILSAGSALAGTIPAADLSITKSASPNPVAAGADLIYTITVSNPAGPNAALSVTLTDTIREHDVRLIHADTGRPSCWRRLDVSDNRLLRGRRDGDLLLTVHIPSSSGPGGFSNTASVTPPARRLVPANNASAGAEVFVRDCGW
jgi:uncharacterized repeat protein (TIGR01451 family)